MTLAKTKLQAIMLPLPDFPDHLFLRDGMSRERGEDRVVPELRRWDFSVSGGKVVRDARPPVPLTSPVAGFARGDDGCVVIPAGATCDFSCYFNMLSAAKWLELTCVENFALSLDMQGEAVIDVHAYHLDDFKKPGDTGRFVGCQQRGEKDTKLKTSLLNSAGFHSEARGTLDIPIGHPDATLVGFSITALSETRLYGGLWAGWADEQRMREVDLCILTTTFRKEEFITRNVDALKRMMAEDDEMRRHLGIIVVDNGRTLDPARFEDGNVRLFGNDNVGGAGGFARGMIEALRLEAPPTHVIIMDDDVLVLPECLKRTYALLKLLKPAYHDSFVSGAMLRLEDRDIQHEDIGYVHAFGFYAPKKAPHRLATIADCAFNEVGWPAFDHEYAAWWFCCIPMKFVREDSLPVPFFVRGDDVEFSLRNPAPPISLNGIGVWHMGFNQKFSAQMEYYQVVRNSFIVRAFHPDCGDIDFLGRVNELFTQAVNEFAYDYADLALDALEDYLSGPSIIEKPNGLDVIREKGKRNEKMLPLAEVFTGDVDFSEVFSYADLGRADEVIRRRTATFSLNGQLMLGSRVTDETGFAPYDWEYVHRPIFMKRRIVAVNPADCTAIMRERDPERFNEVFDRKAALFKRYRATHEAVEEAYRRAYPHLTSIGFWTEYLGLGED